MKKWTALLLVMGSVLLTSAQVCAADTATSAMNPTATTGLQSDSVNPGGPILDKHLLVKTITNANSAAYTDLQGYSAPAITRLTEAGLLPVATAGMFRPNDPVSRQDVIAWLQKTAGISVQDANPNSTTVTRVEVAQWIADALPDWKTGGTGINNELKIYPYDDTSNVNNEQRFAVFSLYYAGIMVGDGHRHFIPDAVLTRGQAAVLLNRILSQTVANGTTYSYSPVTGTLPSAVNTLLDQNHNQPGLYTVVDNGTRYVAITGGSVPTSGYSVVIDSAVETKAGLFLHASLLAPDPVSIQSQIVSYPNLVFTTTNTTEPVYLIGD